MPKRRGGPGWEDLEEMVEFAIRPPAEVLTVGLLIHETDDFVALTDTRSPDLTGGVQKIPKGWIIAIEHLGCGHAGQPAVHRSGPSRLTSPRGCRLNDAAGVRLGALRLRIHQSPSAVRRFRAAVDSRIAAHRCPRRR